MELLYRTGINRSGAAGLMGNLYAESALNPKNLQNSYEKKLGHTDESTRPQLTTGRMKISRGIAQDTGLHKDVLEQEGSLACFRAFKRKVNRRS